MMKYIPNILTFFRILLVPVFVILFFRPEFIYKLFAVITFIVASVTDLLDGKIARKYKVESNLGKFLDPLADKLLVLTAYFSFVMIPEYHIPIWIILIIVFREFVLTGLRILALSENKELKTSKHGKWKTATQMFTISVILLMMLFKTYMIENGYVKVPHHSGEKFWAYFVGNIGGVLISYIPLFLIILATAITLYSGIMYIIANRDLLKGYLKEL